MKDSKWVSPNNESSNIKHLRWTGDNKLKVEFHNGNIYEHENVTREQFEAFRGAESAGKWYHQNLRDNKSHPIKKIQ